MGCARALPAAVSLPDDPLAVPSASGIDWEAIHTLEAAVQAICGTDPLCRRPRLPRPDQLAHVADGEVLTATVAELASAERRQADLPAALQRLEGGNPGTVVVPLLRGYRLGVADRLVVDLRSAGPTEPRWLELAPLLTSLTPVGERTTAPTANPLAFLEREGQAFPVAARAAGDRWALTGWLASPDLPVGPAAAALQGAPYDALRRTGTARLLAARAAGGEADPDAGLEDLRHATLLSLQRAAADRHTEQGAWADTRRAEGAALGVEDPIAALLDRAVERLLPAAGLDRAAGGALVALTARRLGKGCDWPPCQGLDRVETLAAAEAWGPEIAGLARTWRAIALKDAVDAMEVGHDTALFRMALVDLVDALLGTSAGPIAADLLAWRTPAPEVWSQLGAALGNPAPDTWDELRIPLGAHLAAEARLAAEGAPPEAAERLERIARRAVP
ncbi:MAG: hypothetical protein H6732_15320 [Alphaproteobacteria bacterium]|nr:hypothetical protein [Alphaproteobacteria bacterium]